MFRARDWNVHHGKHYVDDVERSVREIDIIAYKEDEIEGIEVHTVCVVSCKTTQDRAWVMLARPGGPDDWMRERTVRHVWTTDDALKYMLERSSWEFAYAKRLAKGNMAAWNEPDNVVFAFQEMDKHDGSAKNDKNIFASIISLLKAQAYEIAARSSASVDDLYGAPKLYQYNLISVVDAPLVRLDYPDGDGQPQPIEVVAQTCLADYIVNQVPVSALIRFVTVDGLDAELAGLDHLHAHNLKYFSRLRRKFYADAVKDSSKRRLFEERVAKRLAAEVGIGSIRADQLSLAWDGETEVALLRVAGTGREEIERLNENAGLRTKLSETLATYYRYQGESRFAVQEYWSELGELLQRLSHIKPLDAG
jgi:hypothetical protein